MKKILLFTTGGTIASKEGNNGLEPEMDANELLSYMGDLANRYDITCRELLSLDSSNIQAEEWRKIARNIFENLEQYDGIVVTHGTDTMAYTASMLSFMLQNLKVPVVLTGSQMPIDNMLTDARNNLYAAFAAIDAGIAGVSVAFNRRIMLGCRAVKVRTLGFEAFESVNAPYLAEVFANGMRRYHEPEKPVPGSRPGTGASSSEGHHPAVLKLIQMTIENGHKAGIWVGICGELGADLTLTETFLRMGVDELSVSPPSVLPLREKVRSLDLSK